MMTYRVGDVFAYGVFASLAVTEVFDFNPAWAFFGAFVIGWALNEDARKQADLEAEAARRQTEQNEHRW